MFADYASDLAVLGRLLLAALLGAAIGWEREVVGKEAGLRTMTLVSAASALFTMVAITLGSDDELPRASGDPIRAVQAIAIGVGFLGAGALRSSRTGIQGLTTAATIWAAAALGIAAAIGRVVVAVGATILFLFVLRVLVRMEPRAR